MHPDVLLASYRSVSSPSSELAAEEAAEQLDRAFERLLPHYTEVIALANVARESRSDIADRSGIFPDAVSKRSSGRCCD